VWTQQLGTSSYDVSHGVSADGLGNVYITGSTYGSLGGPNAGGRDAFVAKFSEENSAVPEPTAFIVWSLLGLSASGIAYRRKRMA
jgi:hypothetical protein